MEMEQKLKGCEVDARIRMEPNESVLILLQHCRDMKRQETRFRLITLLLLLSCATVILFTFYMSGSAGRWGAGEQSPAYAKQQNGCPAVSSTDQPKTKSKRMHIDLGYMPTENTTNGQLVQWRVTFGGEYNAEKRAIVIREKGIYFVYVRFHLCCQSLDDQYETFFVELQKWTIKYRMDVRLTYGKDGISCKSSENGGKRGEEWAGEFRTVYIGGLFDLSDGDHVSVLIREGYNLIHKSSSFGAFLI